MRRLLGIVGNPEDLCAAYVTWVARRRGLEVVELAENELGQRWSYSFDDRRPSAGELVIDDRRVPFEELAGLFVRLYHLPQLPGGITGVAPEHEALFIVERRAGLQQLLACFPRPVVNPPSAGRSNASKPFQMRALEEAGFRVPRWLASNDAEAVAAFLAPLPDGAVYKSCSGLRSRVRRVDDDLLESLAASPPLIAQEYVAGRDVRLHTVLDPGESAEPTGRAFATEVRSADGVDYRFDPGEHDFAACEIPPEIERLCLRVAREEGLLLGGFDFRVSEDGVWHCLEVNPVPTFITYQAATGQPIGEAVVDRLLAS